MSTCLTAWRAYTLVGAHVGIVEARSWPWTSQGGTGVDPAMSPDRGTTVMTRDPQGSSILYAALTHCTATAETAV